MGETKLYYGEMDSPVGPLLIICDIDHVVRIDYGLMTDLEAFIQKWVTRYFDSPVLIHQPGKIQYTKSWFEDYFAGKVPTLAPEFKFHGTTFQKKVWQALFDTIPYGKTRSYKDIAEEIGKPKAVRAVGGAVNKNPFSIIVPCHRVIGANGKMVGYNGGLDKKAFLLNHEKGNEI